MKLADDIWLGSVAARNNLMAAANYSAAFYGNAAVQSWTLGLSAPQRFWAAMARVMDGMDAVPGNADAAPTSHPPDEAADAPETVAEPEAAPAAVAVEVAGVGTAEVADVAAPVEAPEAHAAPNASPLLLDAPRGGAPDDLTAIKGIGKKMAASLNEFGIFHYDQIAGLDADGIDWLDEHLPGFKRNCARFDLVTGAGQLV